MGIVGKDFVPENYLPSQTFMGPRPEKRVAWLCRFDGVEW